MGVVVTTGVVVVTVSGVVNVSVTGGVDVLIEGDGYNKRIYFGKSVKWKAI